MSTELWTSQGEVAHLHGVRCRACNMIFFPPQHYGCESCGAEGDRLEPHRITATGRLHGFTVVHRHRNTPTPFQIAEVLLDAGPVIRARLDLDSPTIGTRVRGAARTTLDAEELVFVSDTGQP